MDAQLLTVQLTVKSLTPLLMHSERSVNPFDPLIKEIAAITAKGKHRTEQDHLQVQRLEWEAGLYYSPTLGPYIPHANLKKCLMQAATPFREGTTVKRSLTPLDPEIPLIYSGPRDIEGLWNAKIYADVRTVTVQRNKILRCRPKFPEWGFETLVTVNTSILDYEKFCRFLGLAGTTTGIGDYRPTYGSFVAQAKILGALDIGSLSESDGEGEGDEETLEELSDA